MLQDRSKQDHSWRVEFSISEEQLDALALSGMFVVPSDDASVQILYVLQERFRPVDVRKVLGGIQQSSNVILVSLRPLSALTVKGLRATFANLQTFQLKSLMFNIGHRCH
jgi:hypothetical protein